uniref:Uncharacterized protein n=1 Tax=Schistocephalus solidus TaxID=70667 RepID=A0A0X3PKJ3_SCHSO
MARDSLRVLSQRVRTVSFDLLLSLIFLEHNQTFRSVHTNWSDGCQEYAGGCGDGDTASGPWKLSRNFENPASSTYLRDDVNFALFIRQQPCQMYLDRFTSSSFQPVTLRGKDFLLF